MKKFTKIHQLYIVSGIILVISCIILSSFPSLEHTVCDWNQHPPINNKSTIPFRFEWFLQLGIVEIALLFTTKKFPRVMAIMVSILKTIFPWNYIAIYNFVQNSIIYVTGGSYRKYCVINSLPYWTTLLAGILVIQHIFMYRKLSVKIEVSEIN